MRLCDEDDWSAAVRHTRHEPAPSVRGTTHRHGGREAAQKYVHGKHVIVLFNTVNEQICGKKCLLFYPTIITTLAAYCSHQINFALYHCSSNTTNKQKCGK